MKESPPQALNDSGSKTFDAGPTVRSCKVRAKFHRKLRTVQVVVDGPVGHELIREQPVVAVGAIAYELHQVRVVQPAQQIHLRAQETRQVVVTAKWLLRQLLLR